MENPAALYARDARYHADIRRELVRAVVSLEQGSLTANLIGLLACTGAAMMMSNATAFILPLILRLVAITCTRMSCARLRRRLADRKPYAKALNLASLCLATSAISWALLLWPLFGHFDGEPFAFVILGVVAVGVCLISALVAPLPKILAGFMGLFLATLAIGMPSLSPSVDGAIILTIAGMGLGIIAFAVGSARQSRAMAEALVNNRRLGEELAEALAHAEFLSQRDPLTGLRNRRALFEDGGAATREQAGDGQLLAIDLDHFKRINDRFGHATGDRVLALTGDAMRDLIRALGLDTASAVRMGGEEFVLLLPDASRNTALAAAEDLRLRITRIAGELELPGLVTSASIGVATVHPGQPIADALHAADLALYRAKHDGRDRVMAAAA